MLTGPADLARRRGLSRIGQLDYTHRDDRYVRLPRSCEHYPHGHTGGMSS